MSTQLKLRRGTTAQHSTFTGAEGEVTVDTTKDTVVVHDGVTTGGVPLAKQDGTNASGTWGINISGSAASATTADSATTATSATNATNLTGTTTSSIGSSALGTGTANSSTFLRGDRTWGAVSGGVTSFNGSTGDVTYSAPAPSAAQIGSGTASLAAGDIGTYCWAKCTSAVAYGGTIAGSTLIPIGAAAGGNWGASAAAINFTNGAARAGTWRAMGTHSPQPNNGVAFLTGSCLFLRIS